MKILVCYEAGIPNGVIAGHCVIDVSELTGDSIDPIVQAVKKTKTFREQAEGRYGVSDPVLRSITRLDD